MSRHYSAGEILHHVEPRERRWHPGLTFVVTVSISVALWIGIAALVWRVL